MLSNLRKAVNNIENKYPDLNDKEKLNIICQMTNLTKYMGNPLFIKTIAACKSKKRP